MLRLCLHFVFVRTKMEILAFEFMILFCTVFLYFANFPILATRKSQCNKYKGFFGGKKMQFHYDWVLLQLFFKSSFKWTTTHLPHKFGKNEIPFGLSFNTTVFKEKQNHENPVLILVTLLILMVHGAVTLVGGEPRGLEHVEFG